MPKLKAAEDADKKNGNEEATKEFYASMRERARIMYDNGETIHETLIKEVPRQVSQEAMAYNLKTDNSGAGVR